MRHSHGLAALGAEHVVAIGQEASAHQRLVALVAAEAVAVPVAVVERDELGTSKTCKIHQEFLKLICSTPTNAFEDLCEP